MLIYFTICIKKIGTCSSTYYAIYHVRYSPYVYIMVLASYSFLNDASMFNRCILCRVL